MVKYWSACWMLSAAVRQSLNIGIKTIQSAAYILCPIPGLIFFINSAVVTIAVLTLGFLGAVYLLRKVGKKRLAFNPARVFIATFLIVLLGMSFNSFGFTLIYEPSTSFSQTFYHMNSVEIATEFLLFGAIGIVPSLIVAAISALIYKFRMLVLKRVFAVGVIVLAVGFISQLYISAFIIHQWLPYANAGKYFDIFEIIPNWMIHLNYPISTIIMIIGVITIASALLYKPIKTHIPHLTQHMAT